MDLSRLLDLPHGLRAVEARILAAVVEVAICSHRPTSHCPRCGIPSPHIHRYYRRTVMDISCAGRAVRLRLQVRKFRCPLSDCAQKVFTERLPEYVRAWARKTLRLVETLTAVGMAVGGRGTETVAPALGLTVSDHTILRLLASRPEPAAARVSVLDVDDFAFRRRRAYGMVLLDLEQHRVIDLLPDRSQRTFALWLHEHPEVRIISRDRGGDYAAGANIGAPQAAQIADRFHLLKHAGRDPGTLFDPAPCGPESGGTGAGPGGCRGSFHPAHPGRGTPSAGTSCGPLRALRTRGGAPSASAKEEVTTYSAHTTRWLLWKAGAELREGEARYVAALKEICPQIAQAQALLERFRTLVIERHPDHLDSWLDEWAQSGISELVGFAQGLRRDYAAVQAALRYQWSQGPVEGHVNRLKTIKRQMYGRAGFALLRRRVLSEPAAA